MADKSNTRPWWAITRIQGLAIMVVGIAMLFIPATSAVAPTVIAVGAGWAGGGTNASETRKIFDTKKTENESNTTQ